MKAVEVNLEKNSYKIKIGSGLLDQLGLELKNLGFQNKAVVITNPLVSDLYGKNVQTSLEKSGFEVSVLKVADGEVHKSLESAGVLYEHLAEIQAERLTPIIALGGGVIGDLAGFVAATYMRGVPFIQVPTTLLAQVDASIGGKVAVNHLGLKNTIGTFYQPRLVISDISTLKTLHPKEMENGLAEIIKYGIIRDDMLFRFIEDNLSKIKANNEQVLEKVIAGCAAIKAEVVEKDEKDLGLRNILNFGHTLGHAFETVSGFKLTHGRAVALGMIAVGIISCKMNVLANNELERIKSVIVSAGLPSRIPELDIQQVIQALQHDKKKAAGKIRFILPRTIGTVFTEENVSTLLIEEVLKELR